MALVRKCAQANTSPLSVLFPCSNTAFNAGEDVQVEWLYVGENTLFDIYVRQGEGFESRRISENLCGSEREGSCRGSVVGQAVVTLPKELEDADDYTLLVVDKEDDDAYGMSPLLSVGLDIAYADTGGGFFSEKSNVVKLSLIIGGCVLGEIGSTCVLRLHIEFVLKPAFPSHLATCGMMACWCVDVQCNARCSAD